MAQNVMSVKTLFEIVALLGEDISVLLRGDHGIGKSQIVRQLAKVIARLENLDMLEVTDKRLSQLTEGDLVGLPSTDGNVTRFNPPDWYKEACNRPLVLFLDELNRATHEVMQAAFQVVLDRELNGWKLHPKTRVFSAINVGSSYTVNEMDPALLDRFFVVDLKPTTEDWCTWALDPEGGDIVPEIVDFIRQNDKWLDPPKDASPGDKTTSRRSFERFSKTLKRSKLDEDLTDPKVYTIGMGFLGVEASIAFRDFVKNSDARITGKDVIENYLTKGKRIQERAKSLPQERMIPITEKVIEYINNDIKKPLTTKQGENLRAFMGDLPDEMRINAWSKIAVQGVDRLPIAKSIHQYCASEILKVFGVPEGEAGVGIAPNVPGIFKKS